MKLLIEKVSKLKIEWLNIIKDCNQQICLLLNIKGMISILTAQNRIFMGWSLKKLAKKIDVRKKLSVKILLTDANSNILDTSKDQKIVNSTRMNLFQ